MTTAAYQDNCMFSATISLSVKEENVVTRGTKAMTTLRICS